MAFTEAYGFICADDAEAIERAKCLVDGHDVELWQFDRRIASFPQKGVGPPKTPKQAPVATKINAPWLDRSQLL